MKKSIITAAFIFCLASMAEPPKGEASKGERPPGPPPKEAVEACKGKAAETACVFVAPKGATVGGKCWTPKPELPMACKPDKPGKQ